MPALPSTSTSALLPFFSPADPSSGEVVSRLLNLLTRRSHSGAPRRPVVFVAVTWSDTVRDTLREMLKKGIESPSGGISKWSAKNIRRAILTNDNGRKDDKGNNGLERRSKAVLL